MSVRGDWSPWTRKFRVRKNSLASLDTLVPQIFHRGKRFFFLYTDIKAYIYIYIYTYRVVSNEDTRRERDYFLFTLCNTISAQDGNGAYILALVTLSLLFRR